MGYCVLLFLTNLLFVVRLPEIGTILSSDQAISLGEMAIPIFAAMPWVLAAGLLGVFPAVGLGLLSGVLLALAAAPTARSLALEYGLLAALLGAAFHQRYRTWVFRALAPPIILHRCCSR